MGFGEELVHKYMSKWFNVTHLAINNPDLQENLKQMYVYCDIIDPQMVGSNALKLLCHTQ